MTHAILQNTEISPKNIPSPPSLPIIGLLREMRSDRLKLVMHLMSTYGDVVKMPLPGIRGVLVTNPHLIAKVLVETERTFTKSVLYERLRTAFGKGLLTSSKDLWQQQHERAAPLFKARMLEGFAEKIVAITENRVQQLVDDNREHTIDITDEMMNLTLKITLVTLFSGEAMDDAAAIRIHLHEIQERSNSMFWALKPMPSWIPTRKNIRFNNAVKAMDEIIYRIIENRLRMSNKPYDILTMFIGDDPNNVDKKQVRDEIITMMLAGHDTTAHALAYSFFLISKHRDCEKKLREEHKNVLGDAAPQWDSIKELNYTKMVFNEAMRLFPPAWMVSRFCPQPLEFDGYSFAAKTTYFLPQFAMHRNPRYWSEPEQFNPERFTKEAIAARPKYAYFPFGGGPRVCIGQALATLEAQIILPMILKKFSFAPVNNFVPNPRITLSPNPNILLLKRAQNAGS